MKPVLPTSPRMVFIDLARSNAPYVVMLFLPVPNALLLTSTAMAAAWRASIVAIDAAAASSALLRRRPACDGHARPAR